MPFLYQNKMPLTSGYMKMMYPSNQSWGAIFITVGKPKQPPRPFQDFSDYNRLSIEMRGEKGGETLEIGIKTNTQPDNGSETKKEKKLTSEWKKYNFDLEEFTGVNLSRLYVVTEFVFTSSYSQTIYFRNINYETNNSEPKNETKQKDVNAIEQTSILENINPTVSITYPSKQYEVSTWSGNRPSVIVRGSVSQIPQDYLVYLVVHPTKSDEAWAHQIQFEGDKWISQAFLGSANELQDGDSFEIFTTIRIQNNPLTSPFIVKDQILSYPSDIVSVKVRVTSWFDKLATYMKDLSISLPVGAFFTFLGGVLMSLISQMRNSKYINKKTDVKEDKRKKKKETK